MRSLPSTDSSNASSSEDVARMNRELAKKAEKIANLESDLDEAHDQIHKLKQKKNQESISFVLMLRMTS